MKASHIGSEGCQSQTQTNSSQKFLCYHISGWGIYNKKISFLSSRNALAVQRGLWQDTVHSDALRSPGSVLSLPWPLETTVTSPELISSKNRGCILHLPFDSAISEWMKQKSFTPSNLQKGIFWKTVWMWPLFLSINSMDFNWKQCNFFFML